MGRPAVVVFDVNETLSDLTAVALRFADLGVPASSATTWFAQVLRDGFALAATGSSAPFREIGAALLRPLLASGNSNRPVDEAVQYVLDGMAALPLHPDVAPGVRALAADGLRLVTLTNGASSVPERLLATAGISDAFEAMLSVDDAGVWKPAPGAYVYAATMCGVQLADMVMVAVHPWDIHGAARAGMQTAWVNRGDGVYPSHFARPDWTVAALDALPAALAT